MKKRLQLKLGGLSLDGNLGLSIDVAKAQDQMEAEFSEKSVPLLTTFQPPSAIV